MVNRKAALSFVLGASYFGFTAIESAQRNEVQSTKLKDRP
jgi:hypothetical protein